MTRSGCCRAILPFFLSALLLAVGIAKGADGVPQSGAFDSTLQTVLTDLQAASQQTPTQKLQVVTAGAVEPTLCPIAATQCPVVETQCPPVETRWPAGATDMPPGQSRLPCARNQLRPSR